MKLHVTKNSVQREIKPSKLQEYLAAGWQQSAQEQVEDVTHLRPPARVKSAVKPDVDPSIENKGE
jgi:hypothetical protein